MILILSVTVYVNESSISEDEAYAVLEDRVTQAVNEMPDCVLVDFAESARMRME